MSYGIENARMISADRVFLDLENLRFPHQMQSEDDAISWLCDNENVFNLAKDIVERGLNPLELIAVIKRGSNSFYAPEGNRRLCAILLLNDPEKAPSKLRENFLKLSKKLKPVKELFCVEFPDRSSVQIWIDRLHGGQDEGRGRSQWDANVKARRTQSNSSKSNQLPLAVLDYGVENDLISEEDAQKKLAIVKRFVGNPVFRNKLGIVKTENNFITDLAKDDFDKLLGKLFDDIIENGFKAHDFDAKKFKIIQMQIWKKWKYQVSGKLTLKWL